MDDQRKDHIDPKGPKQRNRSKQQQIHNLPTDDVENINSISKGRDLLLADKPQVVYIDQHILNENKTRSSYDWPELTTKRHMIWFHKTG